MTLGKSPTGTVRTGVAVLFAFVTWGLVASASEKALHFEKSVRRQIGDLPLAVLRGTEEERARAFGALAGRDLAQMLSESFVPMFNRKSTNGWDDAVAATEKAFGFPESFRKQVDSFIVGMQKNLSEGERLIKAVGRPVRSADLLALHAVPDLIGSGQVPLGGCSSFSAWGNLTENGEVISGRNLDYFTFPGAIPFMVIAQEPSEPGKQRTLEVSVPGILGASTVMNENGVFLMLHDEPGLRPTQQGGWIPRVIPLRVAIETAHAKTAVDDVTRVLRGSPLAMGANIHVSFPVERSDGPGPAVLEWDGNSTDGGVTIRNAANGNAIFCTNHYLKRRNTSTTGSSGDRFQALAKGTDKAASEKRKIDLEAAKRLMNDAAVRGQVSTYLSVIAVPADRQIWVAVAPKTGASATDGSWTAVRWEDVFGK